MPELPEVETIRRDLDKEVVGKRIKTVEVTGMRSIRRHASKDDFITRLEGRKVASIQRRGKYLVLALDDADLLVVHLGMSGQLLRAKGPKEPLAKHTHVVFTFSSAGQLRYVDPRTFGELFVSTPDDLAEAAPELAHLGFDPIEDVISWNRFAEMLHVKKRKLKDLLMDQRFIAGIGNIYSDEILWEAGLRSDRGSDTLSAQEVRRLSRAMQEILQDAIKHRGSSLADQQYRDLFGETGTYQQQHNVYDREGLPCRRCRTPLTRVKAGGRSHFLCSNCQV